MLTRHADVAFWKSSSDGIDQSDAAPWHVLPRHHATSACYLVSKLVSCRWVHQYEHPTSSHFATWHILPCGSHVSILRSSSGGFDQSYTDTWRVLPCQHCLISYFVSRPAPSLLPGLRPYRATSGARKFSLFNFTPKSMPKFPKHDR